MVSIIILLIILFLLVVCMGNPCCFVDYMMCTNGYLTDNAWFKTKAKEKRSKSESGVLSLKRSE